MPPVGDITEKKKTYPKIGKKGVISKVLQKYLVALLNGVTFFSCSIMLSESHI